jgi:pimeloyl-ACP methyl ester carboxylesterase
MTPIVFVPGLLCSAEAFSFQANALWPFGPVTIASTLEGKSLAEIAAAILAAAPSQFALAGISMGGYICFEIMRQAPERVVKLALLNTSARPDTPQETAQRRALLAQAQSGDFKAVVAQVMPAILHPARRNDPALCDTTLRMALTVGLEGFARQTEAVIGRIDSRLGLAAIRVPTLVVAGDSDPLMPPDRAAEMVDAIPQARLVVVPECGHASTLERPDAVNRALIDWITG